MQPSPADASVGGARPSGAVGAVDVVGTNGTRRAREGSGSAVELHLPGGPAAPLGRGGDARGVAKASAPVSVSRPASPSASELLRTFPRVSERWAPSDPGCPRLAELWLPHCQIVSAFLMPARNSLEGPKCRACGAEQEWPVSALGSLAKA
jgi:hypothetical protein